MTDGFFLWTAATIFSAAEAGRPTAAARLHTLRKLRRETELNWVGVRLSIEVFSSRNHRVLLETVDSIIKMRAGNSK